MIVATGIAAFEAMAKVLDESGVMKLEDPSGGDQAFHLLKKNEKLYVRIDLQLDGEYILDPNDTKEFETVGDLDSWIAEFDV